jgi:hypothetical protein
MIAIIAIVVQQLSVRSLPPIVVASPVCGTWNIDLPSTYFSAVQTLAKDDIWFAGIGGNPLGKPQPSFARWREGRLTMLSSQELKSDEATINALAVRSEDDAWAVGYSMEGGRYQPLSMHWGGSNWATSTIPDLPGDHEDAPSSTSSAHAELNAVTIVAPNDVWAIGSYPQDGISKTVALHWDGNTWRRIASPNVGMMDNSLDAIAASATNDVWAFGSSARGSDAWQRQALTLHWDGVAWTVVPDSPPGVGDVSAATVGQSKDIWVVGRESFKTSQFASAVKFATSNKWNRIAIPKVDLGILTSVAVLSADDVWVVGLKWSGYPANARSNQIGTRSVVMHWDGMRWLQVPGPDPSYIQALDGVTVAATGDVWAVGGTADTEDGPTHPMIAHFVPCASSAK